MLQSVRIRAAKAADGMKILRGFFLMWVRLPPPAPIFLLFLAQEDNLLNPQVIELLEIWRYHPN